MYTLVRPQALNGLHTIAFLTHLLGRKGGRLLVIWDGSPIHRRAEVRAFLAERPTAKSTWKRCRRMRPTSTRWNGCGSI